MQKGVRVRVLEDTPEGWFIYEFPGREQPFTLVKDRPIAHHYDKHVGGFWRNRETISFHATEQETRLRLVEEQE